MVSPWEWNIFTEVHDGSAEWKVRKAEDGTVHLGKFSREHVTVGVL